MDNWLFIHSILWMIANPLAEPRNSYFKKIPLAVLFKNPVIQTNMVQNFTAEGAEYAELLIGLQLPSALSAFSAVCFFTINVHK